jgi:cell wall-associated NlpC family hydrolase
MLKRLVLFLIIIEANLAVANNQLITYFPLEKYSQDIDFWIDSLDNDYDRPLADYQQQLNQSKNIYKHYYSAKDDDLSSWSKLFVENILQGENGNNIAIQEVNIIIKLYKQINEIYGENHKHYPTSWFDKVANNLNISAIDLEYNPKNNAIAIQNLSLRAIPSLDPMFYSSDLAGQGYPFDIIQTTSVTIGTPLYIVNSSLDNSKYLVITPDAVGWVDANGVAIASTRFIKQWNDYAKNQGIIAITNNTPARKTIMLTGTTLPIYKKQNNKIYSAFPIADSKYQARIASVEINKSDIAVVPLLLTVHNFVNIMRNRLGDQYGWGGYLFKNDCSAELKSLFIAFGIYLPRNSQYQWQSANKVVNLDQQSAIEREKYLLKYGKKFLTLVQIPGHIFLYIGNHSNPYSEKHEPIALTYQTIWGLRNSENSSRAIIGGTVILPLLQEYPEDTTLLSLYNAERKTFRILNLL